MYDAAGEAKNTTTPATSCGCPQRPSEVRCFNQSAIAGSATTSALLSVAKKPGETALTVIPKVPSSAASVQVSASSPPFAVV